MATLVKSVQRGTIICPSSSAVTATISAVNTAKTMANYTGQKHTSGSPDMSSRFDGRVRLASSTTVSVEVNVANTYDQSVAFEVIEFN